MTSNLSEAQSTPAVICILLSSSAVGPEMSLYYTSLVMRKPAFCICENKDADQLRGNREADQRLCFRYIDSTTPLLSKYEISSQPSCVVVQPALCQTWSETPKTGFLRTRLNYGNEISRQLCTISDTDYTRPHFP